MKAAAVPLLLVAAALAGCAGGGNSCSDFCIDAPTDGSKTYGFRAGVTADNYTWDFGDNSAPAYGADVTHTYDMANGKATPKLFATTGTEKRRYDAKEPLVFGTGNNEKATFFFEAQTKWHIVGEPVRFSASRSHDPDGDALRFAWACLRTADAVKKEPHIDPAGPPPFQSPQAGSVSAGVTNRTLPEPTLVLDPTKDMCDLLGGLGNQPMSTTATTIEGRFQRSGIYKVFLLAADPAHPPVSGEFEFVVSDTRPAPKMTWTFQGKFNASSPGLAGQDLQTGCDLLGQGGQPMVCDVWTRPWAMDEVGALESWFNLTVEQSPAGAGVNVACWAWQSSTGDPIDGSCEPTTHHDNLHTSLPRQYLMVVKAEQGAQFSFTLTVESKMDLDANKIWF